MKERPPITPFAPSDIDTIEKYRSVLHDRMGLVMSLLAEVIQKHPGERLVVTLFRDSCFAHAEPEARHRAQVAGYEFISTVPAEDAGHRLWIMVDGARIIENGILLVKTDDTAPGVSYTSTDDGLPPVNSRGGSA